MVNSNRFRIQMAQGSTQTKRLLLKGAVMAQAMTEDCSPPQRLNRLVNLRCCYWQSPVTARAVPPPFVKGAFGSGELQRISYSDGAGKRTDQKAPFERSCPRSGLRIVVFPQALDIRHRESVLCVSLSRFPAPQKSKRKAAPEGPLSRCCYFAFAWAFNRRP